MARQCRKFRGVEAKDIRDRHTIEEYVTVKLQAGKGVIVITDLYLTLATNGKVFESSEIELMEPVEIPLSNFRMEVKS